MRVAIHQPQFLPWLGFLDKIKQSDCFVILDNVQFKKNEWQNRNRIRTCQGWQWVTVPVLHKFGQRIDDVPINPRVDWKNKHLRAFEMHYGKAAYRDSFIRELHALYEQNWERLVDFNLAVLRWLMAAFRINTPVKLASEMITREDPTDRLIDICLSLGATTYLAGVGGTNYMNVSKFEDSGIGVESQDFSHPRYVQCYSPFVSRLSAIDLLFNCGSVAPNSLKVAEEDIRGCFNTSGHLSVKVA